MPTIQEQLTALISQRASLINRIGYLVAAIKQEDDNYTILSQANKWDEANIHSAQSAAYSAELLADQTQLNDLNTLIKSNQDQITAQTNSVNAASALTTAQASLSPEQLASLQSEQIQSNAQISIAQAQAEAEKAANLLKANYAANRTTYLIVAAVVVLLILGFSFLKIKNKI